MIITIHGDNGSGKSTLAKALAKELGFKHFSTGDFARSLALAQHKDKNILEFMKEEREKNTGNIDIDDTIDGELKIKLEEDDTVIDSRMGYFFGPNTIKIYLLLTPENAADWVWNGEDRPAEKYENITELAKDLRIRRDNDQKRYFKKYGTDCTDLTNYDDVISVVTFKNKKRELLDEVIKKINYIVETQKYR